MSESFRSLASILAERDVPAREQLSNAGFERMFDTTGSHVPAVVAPDETAPPPAPEARAARAPAPSDERIVDLLDTFVAELARLRARATERFEERAEAMLADLARYVLARELAGAPVAMEALLAEALGEVDVDAQIVIRVSPCDARRLQGRYAVVADAGLSPGDFAVEVEDGRYDAALQTRLDAMLASHRIAL